MTQNEIITQIWNICNKNSQLPPASTHKNKSSSETAETMIARILNDSKYAPKRSLSVYECFREQISAAAANHVQYENALKRLTDMLRV